MLSSGPEISNQSPCGVLHVGIPVAVRIACGCRKARSLGLVHPWQVVEHNALSGLCAVSCLQCRLGSGTTWLVLVYQDYA